MANFPFDREIFNLREKLISGDFNLSQTTSDLALRESLNRLLSGRSSGGSDVMDASFNARFLGDGFKVRASFIPSMNISVTAGVGFSKTPSDSEEDIDGVSGLDDTSSLKPIILGQSATFTVPPNGSISERVDIIEVKYNKERAESELRQVLNQATGGFDSASVDKAFRWALDGLTGSVVNSQSSEPLSYKQGLAGGGVPSTSLGYTKIAEVYVAPGTASVSAANIADTRLQLSPSNTCIVAANISLPNVNVTSLAQTRSDLKPTVTDLVAPPGVSVSCYPVNNRKVYNFVITGVFSSVSALVQPAEVFDSANELFVSAKTSLAVTATVNSASVVSLGSRSSDVQDASIANPTFDAPEAQQAAVIEFSPQQIFLDGSDIKYKTVVSSTDADPMKVCLIAILQY